MIDKKSDVSINEVVDRQAHREACLDEALDESFPASDPVSISIDPPRKAKPSSNKFSDG